MRARALLALLLLPLLLAACGGGHHASVRTVTVPPLRGESAPSCAGGNDHSLGQCLPQPAPSLLRSRPQASAAVRCIDTSNNDPILTLSGWQAVRRAGFACAYFKVNEGTGFVDRYAAPQARLARQVGVTVGGYDFQHVCTADAASEARLFVRLLVADGLTGPGSLPGVADTEYPSSTSCNTRSWENTWHATADRALERPTGTYSGAWWWNPHIGCWWEGSFAWISGYVSASDRVPRPCGHAQLDLWQYTDRQFNGANHSDASAWLDPALYRRLANVKPPVPADPYHYRVLTHRELLVVRTYDAARRDAGHHAGELRALHGQLVALSHAVWLAVHRDHPPSWATRHRGERFQVLWPRAQGREVVKK